MICFRLFQFRRVVAFLGFEVGDLFFQRGDAFLEFPIFYSERACRCAASKRFLLLAV
jgi:hypothetical protein